MGIRANFPRRSPVVHLDRFHVPDAHKDWIRSRVGKAEVTAADLDQLSLQADLPSAQRASLVAVQKSLKGADRGAGLNIGADGKLANSEAASLTRKSVAPTHGEPPILEKLRREMKDGLWGQSQAEAGFVRLLKDWISPGRNTPPVLAISGDVGHGKDQAVEAFKRSVFGDEGKLLTVDFAGVKDRDFPDIFGDEGPLNLDALKNLAESKAGMVQILNASGLSTSAPKVASELARRLLAREGDDGFAYLNYIFNFDAPADARLEMVGALGSVGNRVLSGTAEFGHLDGPTMYRYAEALLPDLLKREGLKNVKLELYPQTQKVLGDVLATPHEPLDELEHRLLRFLITHVDTQTSVDRTHGVQGVFLSPQFEDEKALQALIAQLHQPTPNLFAGEDLFSVREVAKHGLTAEDRLQRFTAVQTLVGGFAKTVDDLLKALPDEPEARAQFEQYFTQGVAELKSRAHALEQRLALDARLGLFESMSPGDEASLRESLEALNAGLEQFEKYVLATQLTDPQLLDAAPLVSALIKKDAAGLPLLKQHFPFLSLLKQLSVEVPRARPALEARLDTLPLPAEARQWIRRDLDDAASLGGGVEAEPAAPVGTVTVANAQQAYNQLYQQMRVQNGLTAQVEYDDATITRMFAAGAPLDSTNLDNWVNAYGDKLGFLRCFTRAKELGLTVSVGNWSTAGQIVPATTEGARLMGRLAKAFNVEPSSVMFHGYPLDAYRPPTEFDQAAAEPLGSFRFTNPNEVVQAATDGNTRFGELSDDGVRDFLNSRFSYNPLSFMGYCPGNEAFKLGVLKLLRRSKELDPNYKVRHDNVTPHLPATRQIKAELARLAELYEWPLETLAVAGSPVRQLVSAPEPGRPLGPNAFTRDEVSHFINTADRRLFTMNDETLRETADLYKDPNFNLAPKTTEEDWHRGLLRLWERGHELDLLDTHWLSASYLRTHLPLGLSADPEAMDILARMGQRGAFGRDQPLLGRRAYGGGKMHVALHIHPPYLDAQRRLGSVYGNERRPVPLRRVKGELGTVTPPHQTLPSAVAQSPLVDASPDTYVKRIMLDLLQNPAQIEAWYRQSGPRVSSLSVPARAAELTGLDSTLAANICEFLKDPLPFDLLHAADVETVVRLARAGGVSLDEVRYTSKEGAVALRDHPSFEEAVGARAVAERLSEGMDGVIAAREDPSEARSALTRLFSSTQPALEFDELLQGGLEARRTGKLSPLPASEVVPDFGHLGADAVLAGLFTRVSEPELAKLFEKRGYTQQSARAWAKVAQAISDAPGHELERLLAPLSRGEADLVSVRRPLTIQSLVSASYEELTQALARDLDADPAGTMKDLLRAASEAPAGSPIQDTAVQYALKQVAVGELTSKELLKVTPASLIPKIEPELAQAVDAVVANAGAAPPEQLAQQVLAACRALPKFDAQTIMGLVLERLYQKRAAEVMPLDQAMNEIAGNAQLEQLYESLPVSRKAFQDTVDAVDSLTATEH